MAIDPVCKMKVEPANAAVKAEYRGETHYFCSAHCEKIFTTDPQKYVTVAPAGGPEDDLPGSGTR